MVKALTWIGLLSGAGAACFWLWSSLVPLPSTLDMTWAGEAPAFFGALARQARLSGWAAACASVSVLSQAIALALAGRKENKVGERATDWKAFVEAGRTFFDANRGCPMFQLIEVLDELYGVAHARATFPQTGREEDRLLHACFVICHRALLSAATAIGSGRPEDGPAITRRALEAAKVVLALKAHPENFAAWKASAARKARWEARAQGQKPQRQVSPQYKGLDAEPLYEDLQAYIGTLSDWSVHFTPEHVFGYEWDTDSSFGVEEGRVPLEFLALADQHRLIIRVFDRCFDGKLLGSREVRQVAQRALGLYKDLLQREPFTSEFAATAGETW